MRILIFGGTGSLGKTLIRRYISNHTVCVYSRDEAKHWTIHNELSGKEGHGNLSFLVGDIRDPERVSDAIRTFRPQAIIIAAALKQVDTCERSPDESVKTNLKGTQNVIDAVIDHNAKSRLYPVNTVLFVSTDKACAPVNVYGMCKAISERIVTSKAIDTTIGSKFVGVRYGNVLESRGSIIPLFKHQAANANFLTVTHPDMTRFVMTLDESVDLINVALDSDEENSGSIWVPRLPSMRIGDLAEIFSEMSGKPIKIVGLRPGEKMHEALINESESVRTLRTEQHYIIGPAFRGPISDSKQFEYTSADDVMTKEQLKSHLQKLGILDAPLSSFTGRLIEGIVKK